ncbi:hypothetical protein LTR15_003500 [Elasticomyces elasticus]|nr:hypothetical protein LTR15_003500 [Elasticomyces elasticus]
MATAGAGCPSNGADNFYATDLVELSTQPSGQQVRLLVITPGLLGTLIDAKLLLSRIDDCPPYYALSYSWTTGAKEAEIQLEGRYPFKMTRHLERALQRIRQPTEIVYLWVDFICISQENLDERKAQVGLMADIYSRACCVLIWLGETGDPNSNEHVSFNEDCANTLSNLAEGDEGWWKRLWIVQELLLCSTPPTVHFGAHRFDLGGFVKEAVAFVHGWTGQRRRRRGQLTNRGITFILPDVENEAPYPELGMLWRLWTQFHQEQRHSDGQAGGKLYDLMVQHRSQLCSVPQDRVYALLSLTVAGAQNKFVADYIKPIERLYAEVTGHFLETVGYENGSWPILFNIWELGIPPLPTWSLDFREPRPLRAGALFGFLRQKTCEHPASTKLGAASRSLQTQVTLLDRIASVWDLSGLVLDRGYSDAWMQMMRLLVACEQTTQRRIQHASPSQLSNMRQSHWRLLHDFCVLSPGPYADNSVLTEVQNAFAICEASLAASHDEDQLESAWSQLEHELDVIDAGTWKSARIMADLRQLVLFTTDAGLAGLALSYEPGRSQDRAYRLAQEGDILAVPCGSPTPVILRRSHTNDLKEGSRGVFQLVNACFAAAVAEGKACFMHDDLEYSVWATLK